MTYCVGLRLNRGLVFMSDTRTNAGVDNISTYRKMFTWKVPGERVITMMTAGNLATTQAVVSMLDERSKAPADRNPSILEVPSMFQAARTVGGVLRDVIRQSAPGQGQDAESPFKATIILGGQIKGAPPRLFMIYPEGNFVEASEETPFFQIGETKYGRPILVRAYDPDMSFEAAVKAVETLDACLTRIEEAILATDGQCLITADHGNVEQMVDPSSGQALTSHTNGPVPLVYVGKAHWQFKSPGSLCDIAPTMLTLMAMPIPEEMTGHALLEQSS